MENHLSGYEKFAESFNKVSELMGRLKGKGGIESDKNQEKIVHTQILPLPNWESSAEMKNYLIVGIDKGSNAYILDIGDEQGEEEWYQISSGH